MQYVGDRSTAVGDVSEHLLAHVVSGSPLSEGLVVTTVNRNNNVMC